MPRPAGRRARQNPGPLVTLYAEVAPDIIDFVDAVAQTLNCGRAEAVEEIARHCRGAVAPADGKPPVPEWVLHRAAEQQLPLSAEAVAPAEHRPSRRRRTAAANAA
ncbi:hypothetical protein [Micromonospora sp. NPDC049662]|uniref:hypothetical protein n=1 Tax=Micromonospora sp. NPDC049662 TaxID=3155397 RepID=UPI00342CD69F